MAQNLKSEEFGFEAQKYNEKMIIVAPQLSDWVETSSNQTITLVEYFLENYNIDRSKVYANGYSDGGFINWSFVQEDLVDELSIVIAPVADGGRSSVSIFEKADFMSHRSPAAFSLKAVEQIDGNVLWLRYLLKK